MIYTFFTTEADAAAWLAVARDSGMSGYFMKLREGTYEVRTW